MISSNFTKLIPSATALQMANIASFLRIITAPEEAAESLETSGPSAQAVNTADEALKEAGEMFIELCVPRPWDELGVVQLLVDLVTQVRETSGIS